MSAGVSGPALLSLVWVRESREGVEIPKIGCSRCFRRREGSSEFCCEARRRFPKGEFLSPDILFLQVESQQKKLGRMICPDVQSYERHWQSCVGTTMQSWAPGGNKRQDEQRQDQPSKSEHAFRRNVFLTHISKVLNLDTSESDRKTYMLAPCRSQ